MPGGGRESPALSPALVAGPVRSGLSCPLGLACPIGMHPDPGSGLSFECVAAVGLQVVVIAAYPRAVGQADRAASAKKGISRWSVSRLRVLEQPGTTQHGSRSSSAE